MPLAEPWPSEARDQRRLTVGLGLLFALIAGAVALDLGDDLLEGISVSHALIEGTVATAALVGLSWTGRRFLALERQAQALRSEAASLATRLEASRHEAERFRAEARDLIHGLGEAIDAQLQRWGLSPAEKEVALLLLKGLSHKEVGEIRGVGEATVRQQARALYKKAGLGGRADLAAFFLEDLLGPRE